VLQGIHHITAITGDAAGNVRFHAGLLGQQQGLAGEALHLGSDHQAMGLVDLVRKGLPRQVEGRPLGIDRETLAA
jgi:catechol 2,3-dioxygenase-like lactoylglutathione lyase family enzyme